MLKLRYMPRTLAMIGLGAIALPAPAAAQGSAFHRFEAVATANYVVTQPCPDGSAVSKRVALIGGHEEESENRTTTLDQDFLTVVVRGLDCEGNFVSERGTGPAEFAFSRSLQTADVLGAVVTNRGTTITVDMDWEGAGPMETDQDTTIAPGFTGHFKSQRRDAVATGRVIADGHELVGGSTTNAEIETLEDRQIRYG